MPICRLGIAEILERNPYGIYEHSGFETKTQFGPKAIYNDVHELAEDIALERALYKDGATHATTPNESLDYEFHPYSGSTPHDGAVQTRPASDNDIAAIAALHKQRDIIERSERTASEIRAAWRDTEERLRNNSKFRKNIDLMINEMRAKR